MNMLGFARSVWQPATSNMLPHRSLDSGLQKVEDKLKGILIIFTNFNIRD